MYTNHIQLINIHNIIVLLSYRDNCCTSSLLNAQLGLVPLLLTRIAGTVWCARTRKTVAILDDNLLIKNPGSNDVMNSGTIAAVLVGASSHSQRSSWLLPTLDELKHPRSVV